jgi:transcriptional regulator with XRE-family HTH domain
MLTDGKQIAAARQLLDWSQADLAERAGVSKPSVIRIEKDLMGVKDDIRKAIEKSINDSGIEFTPRGVQEKLISVKTLSGSQGMREFYDDIYLTAASNGGEFFIFNGAPSLIIKFLSEEWYEMHAKRMKEVSKNYKFKVIVKEGEKGLIGSQFAEYRYFPQDQFYNRMFYIYGHNAAFVSFENETVNIIIINQLEIAQSMRILCTIAWNTVAREIMP